MDTELGNLNEITVSVGKTVAQATVFPFRDPSVQKQEYNHGTGLEFPCIIAYKQMHLRNLSLDAPVPAQSSVVRYTKVVTQNMKVFSQCLKNQCWKQLKTA